MESIYYTTTHLPLNHSDSSTSHASIYVGLVKPTLRSHTTSRNALTRDQDRYINKIWPLKHHGTETQFYHGLQLTELFNLVQLTTTLSNEGVSSYTFRSKTHNPGQAGFPLAVTKGWMYGTYQAR